MKLQEKVIERLIKMIIINKKKSKKNNNENNNYFGRIHRKTNIILKENKREGILKIKGKIK